jgi:endonuclease III
MTASNRASKIDALFKSLKKHFKPSPEAPDRSVLEHLLYACCLEDARCDQADEAFAKLQQTYFDWNEVRVTTISELAQCLHSLPHANQAAARIKQCLQSLFEARYQYEIDDLKKANLGKAVAELEAWKGMSPFVVSYVSQQALGGHSIPISQVIVESLLQCEIITTAEAEKKNVPGMERSIPKNKGSEFGSLLLQFAMEMKAHPKSGPVQSVLKDLGVTYKTKPKVEPRKETKSSEPTLRPTSDSSKGTSSAKGKGTDKTEPTQSSQSAKKGETKKNATETARVEKLVQKPGEKKEPATKPVAKPPITKKMAPPASSKQPAAKASSAPKKKESHTEPPKKSAPKKIEKKDDKPRSVSKPKPADTKSKKADDAKAKKRGTISKTTSGSSGSVSSNLTKKKPK